MEHMALEKCGWVGIQIINIHKVDFHWSNEITHKYIMQLIEFDKVMHYFQHMTNPITFPHPLGDPSL
jgi:hypothetical protein